jgi:ribonuclease Y
VGKPDRHEVNEGAIQESNGPDGRERADVLPENDPTAEGSTEEVPAVEDAAEDVGGNETDAEEADLEEFRRRLEAKDRHIQELYDELAMAKLAADEARARAEAGQLRVGDLEEERAEIKERLRAFEEEERKRRRRRERQDRRVARLEREIERREAEIRRLEDLLEERENKAEGYRTELQGLLSRKDAALEDALRTVEGLQYNLEERENEAAELRATVEKLRAEIELEYEFRRRMAEPENRLRAGIDLFNESEHLQTISSISKSLGQPEIHVTLGDDHEPPVILTFVWPDITWRVYGANPGPAVEEPRVYLQGTGEDFSGLDSKPSNARIDPGGRIFLGL